MSEHIGPIEKFVDSLVKSGRAYRSSDGIYFDSSVNQDILNQYPHLAAWGAEYIDGRSVEETVPSAEGCRHREDFALWKKIPDSTFDARNGEAWQSSILGVGRPGWHIECSAMSTFVYFPIFCKPSGRRCLDGGG